MSYTPQPGTIPAKVIEYLRDQPEGFTIATNPLIEAIGHPELGPLQQYMKTALAAGLVAFDRPQGRGIGLWRLGDGVPVARAADEADDEDGGSAVAIQQVWRPLKPTRLETSLEPEPPADPAPALARAPREDAVQEWASCMPRFGDIPSCAEIRRFGLGFGIGVAVRMAERALHADPEVAKALLVDACITLGRARVALDEKSATGETLAQ